MQDYINRTRRDKILFKTWSEPKLSRVITKIEASKISFIKRDSESPKDVSKTNLKFKTATTTQRFPRPGFHLR